MKLPLSVSSTGDIIDATGMIVFFTNHRVTDTNDAHTVARAVNGSIDDLSKAAQVAQCVWHEDVIEKIVEYGGHRENEGGSYATFQKSEARRYRAEADEVLEEVRAMLAAQQQEGG